MVEKSGLPYNIEDIAREMKLTPEEIERFIKTRDLGFLVFACNHFFNRSDFQAWCKNKYHLTNADSGLLYCAIKKNKSEDFINEVLLQIQTNIIEQIKWERKFDKWLKKNNGK